jgi:hypothetical protein
MAKKTSAATPPGNTVDRADNFARAFYALKQIFAPHARQLHVNTDTRTRYYLETKAPSYQGKPLFFGAVVSGRAHVSFHLMPLYWDPSLRKKVSSQLKKHMEDKSTFHFTAPEPALFRELAKLTASGMALYRKKNLL